MNALIICSQISPFNLPNQHSQIKPKPYSLIQKNPSRKWEIEANAKGFSSRRPRGPPPPPPVKESIQNPKQNNFQEDEEIPKEVYNRLMMRILVSVGAPMGLGLAFLSIFGLIKEHGLWDVPIWIPFLTTFLTFGASALGIAYGALSTNLDANKQGSLLGFEEAQQNWVEMWKEENDSN